MQRFFLIVLVMGSSILSGYSQVGKHLVPYIWQYRGAIHGTILVPPGFKAETQNYMEGIVTYLRYADSSYIVLQHGGMYRIPMFQDSEYDMTRSEEREDRTVRTGSIKNTERFWREDNLKKLPNAEGKLHPLFYMFPPNIAYDKIPKERTKLFDEALNSFVWGKKR